MMKKTVMTLGIWQRVGAIKKFVTTNHFSSSSYNFEFVRNFDKFVSSGEKNPFSCLRDQKLIAVSEPAA